MQTTPSGSQIPFGKPVDVLNIGKPGWPGQLIIHDGKLTIYGANGETLIEDGKIQTDALDVGVITADKIAVDTITADHIVAESITNNKITKWARAKQAVVDTSGEGDFTTIAAAVTYLTTLGGGVIFLTPGLYTVTSNIYLDVNISIIGVDPDLCFIDFQAGNRGILGYSKKNFNLENVTLQNSTSTSGAVYLSNSAGHIVRNCKFTGNVVDVEFYHCTDSVVEFCGFSNTAQPVYVNGGSNIRIRHNSMISTTSANGAIRLTGSCAYILLFDNYIDGHQSATNGAIYADNANYVKIIGNVVKDSNGHGIYVSGAFTRSLISENTVYSCNGDGIKLTGIDSNVIINNNHSTYNGGKGLYIDTIQRVVGSGNVCTDNISDGFYIKAGGSPFVGNEANGNGGYGFNLWNADAYITMVANNIHWNAVGTILNAGGSIDEHNSKLG